MWDYLQLNVEFYTVYKVLWEKPSVNICHLSEGVPKPNAEI